jgi:hypothetical protein
MENIPLQERLFNAFHSYTLYLVKFFWPYPLSFHYPHPLGSIPLLENIGSFLLIGLLTWVSIRFCRSLPYLTVGWFWYLGALVPVIGLVQVGSHAMADRYTYIPLVGIFIAIAWGAEHAVMRWNRLRRPVVALFACSIVVLSVCSWRQTAIWKDSMTLYQHAVRVTPENFLPHNNLGNVLARQGRLEEAAQHLREVLRLRPDYAPAYNNLGNVLMKQEKVEEGILHYQTALRIKPDLAEARLNLELINRSSHLSEKE